jgi:hypothetical protein
MNDDVEASPMDDARVALGEHERRRDPDERVYFETADDGLAAFLEISGVRRMGLGFSSDETDPAVTHVFDDTALKVLDAASRFQLARGDEVSAARFIAVYRRLREVREDEALRRRRQRRSDLARAAEDDGE